MSSIISVSNLAKTYATGFQALKGVDLEIRQGEILALLGPNGPRGKCGRGTDRG
jgi:ABC-2 type transport system ATP-binding protein